MKRFSSLLLLLALFVLTGQGCLGGGGGTSATLESVELDVWRVFDDDDTFDGIISSYRALHPNVKINYRELRASEYEDELIRAFAEGRGPDVLSVHNTKMVEFQNLLLPMPETVTVTQQETRGSVRREVVTTSREKQTMSQRQLKQSFVEQVAADVILDYQPDPKVDAEERIYGLPLALDSLALFYNKDLLNAAGIATPPETWSDFQTAVTTITTYDNEGEVRQSAAALGTSENVERSTDILTLLMMQNGTEMTDERGRVAFHQVPDELRDTDIFPALDATVFYTDFANPTKEVYTWNESYSSSFDAFAGGETAFFFGYSYHTPLLKTTAPKLNFDVTQVPQIQGGQEVNFANYWIEAVASSTDHPDWAWDFVLHAADAENVGSYLEAAGKPTALRDLISTQLEDETLGVFASQTLTARNWYHGKDAEVMEQALKDLIDGMLASPEKPEDLLTTAAKKVSQTY